MAPAPVRAVDSLNGCEKVRCAERGISQSSIREIGMSRDVLAEREVIDRIVDGLTLLEVFAQTVEAHRNEKALSWKSVEGWRSLTWGE